MSAPTPHWTVLVTCCLGSIAAVVVFVDRARAVANRDQPVAGAARRTALEYSAYTNAETAHMTFTNLSQQPAYRCVKGTVKSLASGSTTETVVVCTGDVKPHSTAVLEAPYHVGAVKKLCSGEPDRFGNTPIDWDRCVFDVIDVP